MRMSSWSLLATVVCTLGVAEVARALPEQAGSRGGPGTERTAVRGSEGPRTGEPREWQRKQRLGRVVLSLAHRGTFLDGSTLASAAQGWHETQLRYFLGDHGFSGKDAWRNTQLVLQTHSQLSRSQPGSTSSAPSARDVLHDWLAAGQGAPSAGRRHSAPRNDPHESTKQLDDAHIWEAWQALADIARFAESTLSAEFGSMVR